MDTEELAKTLERIEANPVSDFTSEEHAALQDAYARLRALSEQNRVLRETLEFYAWADHYTADPYMISEVVLDKGDRARRALEEAE